MVVVQKRQLTDKMAMNVQDVAIQILKEARELLKELLKLVSEQGWK